jgi:phosphatidate cytidylyltransferase
VLFTRILTAAIAGPAVVALVIVGPQWGFPVLVVLIGGVGLHEFHGLTFPVRDRSGRHFATGVATSWTALAVAVPGGYMIAGLAAAAIAIMTFHLAKLEPIDTWGQRVGASLAGLLYGALPMAHLCWTHALPDGNGWRWIVMLFMVVWGGDSAAYFGGRALGRHKLYPLASPNKTVEGAVAGMLGAVGAAFLARAWFHGALTVSDCVVLGLGGGILGPIGDLVQSVFKRSAGVKDSGNFFPGHGGVLDRVDALLFAAPLFHWYAVLVAPL